MIKNYKMRGKEPFSKNMFNICTIVLLSHKFTVLMITSRLAVLAQRYFSLASNLWRMIHVIQNQNSVERPIFHQDENDECSQSEIRWVSHFNFPWQRHTKSDLDITAKSSFCWSFLYKRSLLKGYFDHVCWMQKLRKKIWSFHKRILLQGMLWRILF